ncbi:MAG: imidazole glycerol phosphate synthase subunit HisH [Acidimicrobiales bacterium]
MIAVIDYGIGNLRSAEKALHHVGASAALTSDPELVDRARGVVLPGVGAFGSCRRALATSGLEGAVRRAIDSDRPFLGICVGMQMLYEASEEAPGVDGLGVLPGVVTRLPETVKRPQMQWNRLQVDRTSPNGGMIPDALADGAWMYFVHSFSAPSNGPEVVATSDYGGPVAAAVVRGNLWATQFHPEKSSTAGLALLREFVTRTKPVGEGD